MENKEQYSMPRCDIEELKGQIEQLKEENQQLKELLNYIRDEIADMPACSYQWGFRWVHEAAYRIDKVLK